MFYYTKIYRIQENTFFAICTILISNTIIAKNDVIFYMKVDLAFKSNGIITKYNIHNAYAGFFFFLYL